MKNTREVGLQLRFSECHWAEVRRQDRSPTPVRPELAELLWMAEVAPTKTMSVMGAIVDMQADHDMDGVIIIANVWEAFHAKALLRRSKGSVQTKSIVPNLTV